MDWFKGKFTGKPHTQWENLWFPVGFPLNQSIEKCVRKPTFDLRSTSCQPRAHGLPLRGAQQGRATKTCLPNGRG